MTKSLLRVIASLLLVLCGSAVAQSPPANLAGEDLRAWLREHFYRNEHHALGYQPARRAMYNFIDNHDNAVLCVYGGFRRPLPFGGSESNPGPINAEHTVPQSFFSEEEPMRSDLHHLFPTYSRWNSTRQNFPFREIPDNETTKWMILDRYQSAIPTTDIDDYSEFANQSFEPREDHKGNVARAVFYFYTMYPDYLLSQVGDVDTLYAWHLADPVDDREQRRNEEIEERQGNRNPFIDHPEWVETAWPGIHPDRVAAVVGQMGLDIPVTPLDAVANETPKPLNELRLHSLNVGAGSCHVIECPGNTSPILYDCGYLNRSAPDLSENEVVGYVRGILDRYADPPIVIISHADRDHYRYIPTILANRRPRTVWFGGARQDFVGDIGTWLDAQEQSGVPVVGDITALPPGFSNDGNAVADLACGTASTFVLTVNEGTTKNSMSLVARIEHGDFSVTLTGDATKETQDGAIENFSNLQTTVLTGSHHGAITHGSNAQAWANATHPAITIFSSGTSFAHPRCNAVDVYREGLMPSNAHEIWCGDGGSYRTPFMTERAEYVTRTNGTVVISSDGESTHRVDCSLSSDCGF